MGEKAVNWSVLGRMLIGLIGAVALSFSALVVLVVLGEIGGAPALWTLAGVAVLCLIVYWMGAVLQLLREIRDRLPAPPPSVAPTPMKQPDASPALTTRPAPLLDERGLSADDLA